MLTKTDFTSMTTEQALEYCYDRRDAYIGDLICDSNSVGDAIQQFECLISCIESGQMMPAELPSYGMEY